MSASLTEIAATLESLIGKVGPPTSSAQIALRKSATILRRRARKVGDQFCIHCGYGEGDRCHDAVAGSCEWAEFQYFDDSGQLQTSLAPNLCSHCHTGVNDLTFKGTRLSRFGNALFCFNVIETDGEEWLLADGADGRFATGSVIKASVKSGPCFAWVVTLPVQAGSGMAASLGAAADAARRKVLELRGVPA